MSEIIPLSTDGEARFSTSLNGVVAFFITRYNHNMSCWVMDILDGDQNQILTGLVLVPWVDILKPYPQLKRTLGSLMLIEYEFGQYQETDLLGTKAKLIWAAPGESL